MTKGALLALIAVAMALMAPVSINFSPEKDGVSFMALDVCHANGHFAKASQDTACLRKCPVLFHKPQTGSPLASPAALPAPFLAAAEKDRPPSA
ncbi:MAG: hypothetical protein M0Z52_04660 [Actinomycetota bacterium]|nr:hypothetical protein [Actinomycetota bacterium]